MDIELGIANVARPVTFSTEEDAASVTEAIESALSIRAHRLRDQARRELRGALTERRAQMAPLSRLCA